jgi:hypothetical protein
MNRVLYSDDTLAVCNLRLPDGVCVELSARLMRLGNRVATLEEENSSLQKLVRYLLTKNETLRRKLNDGLNGASYEVEM